MPATEERRRSARHRVLKPGRIVFNEGYSSITCTLRDLSTHGARLQVSSPIGIPVNFHLKFDGRMERCRLVRREADHVGVEFLMPGDPPP
jgi:hypothetical protein